MASYPNACLNILKVSKNIFPTLKQNLPSNQVAHENNPFLIAEKFTQQAIHTFTLIDTAQWLSKLQQSGMWHLLRKLTAMQHNQWDRAPCLCWHANSKVWKFYRLTSYGDNIANC
jgi:hypothetical protein